VRRLVGAYGIGRVINPKIAHSQCIGGMVGGIGMALLEDTCIDPRFGRGTNANLAEYLVPVNADVQELDVVFVDEHDPHINPLGAKGVAEIAICGVAPRCTTPPGAASASCRSRPRSCSEGPPSTLKMAPSLLISPSRAAPNCRNLPEKAAPRRCGHRAWCRQGQVPGRLEGAQALYADRAAVARLRPTGVDLHHHEQRSGDADRNRPKRALSRCNATATTAGSTVTIETESRFSDFRQKHRRSSVVLLVRRALPPHPDAADVPTCCSAPLCHARGGNIPCPLQINDTAPDFEADTTEGRIRFYDWVGDSWCVIFSHPKDFTPVCTTELGYMAKIKPEFDKRNCKILALSVDTVDDHKRWSKDIKEAIGHAPNYPMIGDGKLAIAKLYQMLPASAGDTAAGRTPADNATVRNVYIIGPDKKIKLVISYPMSTGRNFAEVLRALDSVQLTAKHQVATPVNWEQGDDVIIVPSVSDEAAKAKFPGGWKAPKPYMRIVPQPRN
jgi:thioredoxin-dependent peroxiredoxin